MSKPKLSFVILSVNANDYLEDLTLAAIDSYRPFAYEIIITEDHGRFSEKLAKAADSYLYHGDYGFTKNVNTGWKYATGDYVAIVNNDTRLVSGDMLDLCIPGKVTSPIIVNQEIKGLAGPFWVVPKEVAAERGYLMEEMKTYASDEEYAKRVEDIFQKVPSVQIYHEQAQTVKTLGIEGGEEAARDNKIYEDLKQEGKAK